MAGEIETMREFYSLDRADSLEGKLLVELRNYGAIDVSIAAAKYGVSHEAIHDAMRYLAVHFGVDMTYTARTVH